jgi:hypothetical protein
MATAAPESSNKTHFEPPLAVSIRFAQLSHVSPENSGFPPSIFTQYKSMRRIQYVFALSCLTLAACSDLATSPAPVSAIRGGNRSNAILQNDVLQDVPAALYNPCNGEVIAGTARLHMMISTNDTKSGNTMTDFSSTLDFDGIGEVTGTIYNGRTREGFNYSLGTNRATEFSIDSELLVISKGSAENFSSTARVHITYNANGTPAAEVELVKASCK